MTDLNSLMIFAKVVEAKSFSDAARRLKIPLSTVSRRVADLEKQLGVRLIERSTRRLRPSTAAVAPYLFVSPVVSIALAICPRASLPETCVLVRKKHSQLAYAYARACYAQAHG